jgi:Immunoglobulin I-set domain
LNIECHVWGWPVPTVSWRRGSQPLNASDPRISFPNDTGVDNVKVLQIVETTPDDRDDYVCVAVSKFNDTFNYEETSSTLVRVKSKKAMFHSK